MTPLELAETARSNRYLSVSERRRIAALQGQNLGAREIAGGIGRDAGTVSRELRRNRPPHGRDYDADLAPARARERARRPRRTRLSLDAELRAAVQGKLELEWSPEQIADWLRAAFPLLVAWHVCHETIYQALYHGGRGGLSRTLTKRLRTVRPLRKAPPPGPTSNALRGPVQADRPTREGDLIVGRGGRSAIGILVERRTGLVRVIALPD